MHLPVADSSPKKRYFVPLLKDAISDAYVSAHGPKWGTIGPSIIATIAGCIAGWHQRGEGILKETLQSILTGLTTGAISLLIFFVCNFLYWTPRKRFLELEKLISLDAQKPQTIPTFSITGSVQNNTNAEKYEDRGFRVFMHCEAKSELDLKDVHFVVYTFDSGYGKFGTGANHEITFKTLAAGSMFTPQFFFPTINEYSHLYFLISISFVTPDGQTHHQEIQVKCQRAANGSFSQMSPTPHPEARHLSECAFKS